MSKIQRLASIAVAAALTLTALGAVSATAASAAPRGTPDASVAAAAAAPGSSVRYQVVVGKSPINPPGSLITLAGIPFSAQTHQPVINAPGVSLAGRWDPNRQTMNQYGADYAVTYRVGAGNSKLCVAKNSLGKPVFWNCANVDGLPPFQLTEYPVGYEIPNMQFVVGNVAPPLGARVMGPWGRDDKTAPCQSVDGCDPHNPRNWIGIDQELAVPLGRRQPKCGIPMEGNDTVPYCSTYYRFSADRVRAGQSVTVSAFGDRPGLRIQVKDTYEVAQVTSTKVRVYVDEKRVIAVKVKQSYTVTVKVRVKYKSHGKTKYKTVSKKVTRTRVVTVHKTITVKVPKDVMKKTTRIVPVVGATKTCTTGSDGRCSVTTAGLAYALTTGWHRLLISDGRPVWNTDLFVTVTR